MYNPEVSLHLYMNQINHLNEKLLWWTKCERENKLKFIFTLVYWGERITFNIFSLPFIGERNKILNIFSFTLGSLLLDVRAPNSLIVAVLTAIPTMKTALTHFQYRYLEEQVDCEWSRDHTNNPTVRLLHTSKHSIIIVCQWNVESLASLVLRRPICWL